MATTRAERSSVSGPERTQLPDEVAAYVRELILSGQVRPEEFLRMEPIAEALNVSVTPVREGLLTLRGEGFLKLVPRRGFVVAPFTPEDVRDLFWAQAQLASELAARAAKRITAEELDSLEAVDAEYGLAVAADDRDRIAEAGHAFHTVINRAAQSRRLALLLDSIVRHLPSDFYATIEGQIAATGDEHPQLVDALRNHQVRKARSIMEQHILGQADHIIETLEARGLWNTEQSA